MKIKKLFLFLLLFNMATLSSQTTICGCGDKADGRTIEFAIVDNGSSCCDGRVIQGTGFLFEWEHQGVAYM
jgi:hypothetical protein